MEALFLNEATFRCGWVGAVLEGGPVLAEPLASCGRMGAALGIFWSWQSLPTGHGKVGALWRHTCQGWQVGCGKSMGKHRGRVNSASKVGRVSELALASSGLAR